jgi:replication factor C large subunit
MLSENMPWIKKYSPKKEADLEGLSKTFSELKKLVLNFKKGKAIMLYGGSGAGKTSSCYALAHDLNLELIEINASDTRNAGSIESIIGAASKQMSLFHTGKIILVDEVEGLSGHQDRGGVGALVSVVEESKFPVIVTCQDPYSDKLKPLRKASILLEFTQRPYTDLAIYLKKICALEKIEFEEEAINSIARRSNGDLRAAINDLQSVATQGKKLLKADAEHLSDREKTEKIEDALMRIFKTTDPKVAKEAMNAVDEDLDEIFLWVDENLPKEYLKPEDLARGFEQLSKADVFKGRIMRWQHYRFYVYCYDLLSSGIAISKDEKYKGMTEYKETGRKLKIWIANMKNMKKKAIAEKIALKTHTAKKHAFRDTLPYLKKIFRNDKEEGKKIAKYLELDPEQVEYLST